MNSTLDFIERMLLVTAIFFSGFLVSLLIQNLGWGIEFPRGLVNYDSNNVPSDRIQEEDIEVYDDKIIVKVDRPSISSYANTGSMLPVIDEGANGIRVVPKNEEEIQVGDIITFQDGEMLIVHRVVEMGEDSEGKYFITKGDSNAYSDGKIRFSQIKYITIGVLY